MKASLRKGLGFGLTSGIITTLGLITGLNSFTHSRIIVIGGILTLAVADSLSDAFGGHMSEESGRKKPHREIWESTFSTLVSKIAITLSFLLPFLFLNLKNAVILSVIWGFLLIIIFSYYVAAEKKKKILPFIGEHLLIAVIVIVLTHFLGSLIPRIVQ